MPKLEKRREKEENGAEESSKIAGSNNNSFEEVFVEVFSSTATKRTKEANAEYVGETKSPKSFNTNALIKGIVISSTKRGMHPQPQHLFSKFLVEEKRLSFGGNQWNRPCANASQPWTLACQKLDFLALLQQLTAMQRTSNADDGAWKAFYIIEDDTFYCKDDFSTLASIVNQVQDNPLPGLSQVRVVQTGIGASGLLILQSALDWFLREYANHDGDDGPDVFLASSRKRLRHVYRLRINLNVHVGGASILGWNDFEKPMPSCFEFACGRGMGGYDFYNFAVCNQSFEIYSAISGCPLPTNALVDRDKVVLRGYPGFTCRKRKDAWHFYNSNVKINSLA